MVRIPLSERLMVASIAMLTLLVFWRSMRSFILELSSKKYINAVEIDKDLVKFGIDEAVIPFSFARDAWRVSNGFSGTLIMRHPTGVSITIPKNAVTLVTLRRVLEGGGK